MIPLPCRLFIALASLLVPSSKRAGWRREWRAELWHRAQAGASFFELLRRSRGVFRDAAWMFETDRKKNGLDPFRKPLRTEAIVLCIALLICLAGGGFSPPRLPYTDAGRLANLDRKFPSAGGLDSGLRPALVQALKQGQTYSGLAEYKFAERTLANLSVAKNFFELLGAKAVLGRTFQENDANETAVITYGVWRSRFHSDPNVLDKFVHQGGVPYRIIGVMPKDFWFRSDVVRFYTPLPGSTRGGEAVIRLKPGVEFAAAQNEIRTLAHRTEATPVAKSFFLIPLLQDHRLRDLGQAWELAMLCAILGVAFLTIRRHGGWRCRAFLGGRIVLCVLGLYYLRTGLSGPYRGGPFSNSFFAFWIFLLVCCAVTCLLWIDHRGRCPVCLRRLRKPVSIGTWSSQILDQPATEYLCPSGHGTLYVAETGNAPDHWTVLDESWQDLFAHTEE